MVRVQALNHVIGPESDKRQSTYLPLLPTMTSSVFFIRKSMEILADHAHAPQDESYNRGLSIGGSQSSQR